ncbi:MAG: glycosyltransferase family 87 protein [Microthrixaceae bacterium]
MTALTTERSWRARSHVVLLACVAVYLPFTLLGYGTDIDVANVLRAGRTYLRDGEYFVSRWPGSTIHEVATALLDRLGGSVAVNLAGVGFAALALWSIHRIALDDDDRWPNWTMLLVAANPWFWLASTSLGDFVWALGLGLGAVVAARHDRRVLAGVLFGLAIGCRLSTVTLALAWLVAERLGERFYRPTWRATFVTAAVLGLVGTASFVPAWLASGRTFDFLGNQPEFPGLGLNLGRWAVKNAAVIGVPTGIVLLVGVRRGLGALARWRASAVVRFAVLVVLSSELVFFRFPWKPVHLLPVIAGFALLVGASPAVRRGWLVALVVAQILGGLVSTTIGEPDVPHHARSGRLVVRLTEGPLLNDVRCRLDDRRDGPWPDPAEPDGLQPAMTRAAILFDCQSETWKVVP